MADNLTTQSATLASIPASTVVATKDYVSSHHQRVVTHLDKTAQEQASSGLTTASTTYTLGDTLGAGWTFTSMARASGGGGRIKRIRLYDKADVVSSIALYFYKASVTFGTDNSAPGISDGDQANFLFAYTLGFKDLGGSRVSALVDLDCGYYCAATSLFVYAETLSAHSFFGAAGDLPLELDYALD